MNIYEKLLEIQNELKAPKSQYNKFGKYYYRNCEDILEAVKPLCKKHKVVLIITDDIESNSERYYVKATAKLVDVEKENSVISVNAYAREEENKKGMDGSQVTGSSSSYARKYALNGLFNIDDTKDSDTTNNEKSNDKTDYICCDCKKAFNTVEREGKTYTAEDIYNMAKKKSPDGKARCKTCRAKFESKENEINE